MKSILIQKIEQEQKHLEVEAMKAAVTALKLPENDQKTIIEDYDWLLTIEAIQKKLPKSQRVMTQVNAAREKYSCSLAQGIKNAKPALKLESWTRAGQAMQAVFRKAYQGKER